MNKYVPRKDPEELVKLLANNEIGKGSFVQDPHGNLFQIVGQSELQNPELQGAIINRSTDLKNKYLQALALGEDAYSASAPKDETFQQKALRLGIQLAPYNNEKDRYLLLGHY